MDNRIILAIVVDGIGWVYAEKDKPIEVFTVNGEMSLVNWYRKVNEEYNGRYVEYIRYNM